jgi:hypothetical protein
LVVLDTIVRIDILHLYEGGTSSFRVHCRRTHHMYQQVVAIVSFTFTESKPGVWVIVGVQLILTCLPILPHQSYPADLGCFTFSRQLGNEIRGGEYLLHLDYRSDTPH